MESFCYLTLSLSSATFLGISPIRQCASTYIHTCLLGPEVLSQACLGGCSIVWADRRAIFLSVVQITTLLFPLPFPSPWDGRFVLRGLHWSPGCLALARLWLSDNWLSWFHDHCHMVPDPQARAYRASLGQRWSVCGCPLDSYHLMTIMIVSLWAGILLRDPYVSERLWNGYSVSITDEEIKAQRGKMTYSRQYIQNYIYHFWWHIHPFPKLPHSQRTFWCLIRTENTNTGCFSFHGGVWQHKMSSQRLYGHSFEYNKQVTGYSADQSTSLRLPIFFPKNKFYCI